MPPKLALLCAIAFVVYAFRTDWKRTLASPSGLFWPTLWYLVVASRPVGVWLMLWGVPLPGGSGDPTEGSVIERWFYGGLTVIGLWILSRRRFEWGAALRGNPWLVIFFGFMAASVLWSDYQYVSFKRFIKVFGSIVMALVVLTNERPLESILTVLRRCLYVHLPMSILCVKYFRDIGVSFDWSGASESWQGISTSKNTLGQIAMLGVLYFCWEIKRHWHEHKWRSLHVLYLAMAIYLLKGSEDSISMTAVSVAVFALAVFFRLHALHAKPIAARRFVFFVFTVTVGLIGLIVVHSVVLFSEESLFGRIITTFGRDITLTDRTAIWSDVYDAAGRSPLVGIGYGGFWIGRLANIPWTEKMTWTLGQAHSGYVDTYLQLGWVGVILLAIVLISTLRRLLTSLPNDFDFGCFRITLFMTILFVNITETTYLRGDHHLWFLMMLVIWMVPATQPALSYVESNDVKNNEGDDSSSASEPTGGEIPRGR